MIEEIKVNMLHEHENHEKEGDNSFNYELEKWRSINKAGSMEDFLNTIPEPAKEKAFSKPESMIVVCIDEGCTCNSHAGNEPELNFAGSGILYDVDATALVLQGKNISVITSHDGCGAGALANKDPYQYTSKLVEKINTYRTEKDLPLVKHEHIAAKEMTRHESFHEATAVYFNIDTVLFDATRILDEDGNEIMPKGFTIDAGHFTIDNSLAELGVSIDIAFGDHGFGKRFSTENPFTIVFVGNDSDLEKETITFLQSRKEFKNGLLKIDYIKNN